LGRYAVKILFLADTHLGFDLPDNPRILRRRRGEDFFENYNHVLSQAKSESIDLVIHGGDVFFRSRIPAVVIERAFTPLIDLAEKGIPVVIVPGNHERGKIPLHLWTAHPCIHIFHRPTTFTFNIDGLHIGISGFPFTRSIRESFPALLNATGHEQVSTDISLLCMHQTVEGATVGPSNFVFRRGKNIIRGRDIPAFFDAVCSGHIHRGQILRRTLDGARLRSPVIYPGSIERTSYAERNEGKYYCILELSPRASENFVQIHWKELATRPMNTIMVDGGSEEAILEEVRERLKDLDPNSIVRVEMRSEDADLLFEGSVAEKLRAIAPTSMNINLARRWRKN
jgi:DNA repair exonuclease SbcCD nuclease subunit